MEHHIGALPRTPFPASRDFPSRGNERYEGKNRASYTSGTISAFSPFGGWRHHLARWEACHMTHNDNPVTLALYLSPDRAIPQPSARRAVKLKKPWARKGPSILRTFFHNPSAQPAAEPRPFLTCGESRHPSPKYPYFFIDISHFSVLYCTLRAGKMIAGRKA